MHQDKPPADEAGVASKELAHLLGAGAGANVKIFRFAAKEQVAYAAAHEIGLVTCTMQAIEHLQSGVADLPARNVVLFAGNDPGTGGQVDGLRLALGRLDFRELCRNEIFQGDQCVIPFRRWLAATVYTKNCVGSKGKIVFTNSAEKDPDSAHCG